jgi:hypothetical protein
LYLSSCKGKIKEAMREVGLIYEHGGIYIGENEIFQ